MSTISHLSTVRTVELDFLPERAVISRDGAHVGTVVDVVRRDGRIVAFDVSGFGMFSSGAGHVRLPVSTIVRIDGDDVHVARTERQLIS